jgi:altronate dehydratase
LGLTSTSGSFARALLDTVKAKYSEKTMRETYKNIDGIVAVSHTEGTIPNFSSLQNRKFGLLQ